MFDVVVIGCGITGAAVVYELSKYDLSVAVLEKENDISCATTKANSGIVHAGYDPSPGTLMAKLNIEGAALTETLCADLDVPYNKCGALVLAFSDEDKITLERLYQRGIENGVTGMEIIPGDEVRRIEPNISDEAAAALLVPSAGIVSPWEFALALTETAAVNGVNIFLNYEVTDIKKTENGYLISSGGQTIEAKMIVNAAGLYADTIHNMAAPPAFKIIPDRGEYFLLDKSECNRVSRVIFQCPSEKGKGTLVAPTAHGNLIVGPNNEPPLRKDDTSTTREGLAEVVKSAKKSVPSIVFRDTIRNFSGVRAASDIDDFIIAPSMGAPGFIDAAGIKSPGLTAAPAVAKMVAGLLEKEGLKLFKKENFKSTRKKVCFEKLSPSEKEKLVSENASYGRVICRCETVTEGEILDALKTNLPPVSVDGVKRRTSAGMGRCQGGFCGPKIVDILAKHYGVTPDKIMQDTSGTHILTGITKAPEVH